MVLEYCEAGSLSEIMEGIIIETIFLKEIFILLFFILYSFIFYVLFVLSPFNNFQLLKYQALFPFHFT